MCVDFTKDNCYRKWKSYRKLMNSLTMTPDYYRQMKRTFMGGFTHANANYVDVTLTDVGMRDISSSYPYVMISERFPMSAPISVTTEMSEDEFNHYLRNYNCAFALTAYGVKPKRWEEHPLSASKCDIKENWVEDNGRIVTADKIRTWVTEQDYFTYKEYYDFDEEEISNFYYHESYHLPIRFIESVLDLYQRKTILKDVEGKEIEYAVAKGMVNSTFGMSVTDPVRDEIIYKSGNLEPWVVTKADIEKAINRYNTDIRRFLYYPWGVWITAYARRNLFKSIKAVGRDFIYADTDSDKFLNPNKHKQWFENYNASVIERLNRLAKLRHHDISMYIPKDSKGIERPLGIYTLDDGGYATRFKTLGAKRYLYEKPNGEQKLTVAGTNKTGTLEYLNTLGDPFEHFKTDLYVPPEYAKRNIAAYGHYAIAGNLTDYKGNTARYYEKSFLHISTSGYSFDRSQQFTNYLLSLIERSSFMPFE